MIPRRLVGLASILVDLSVEVPALPPRGGDVLGRETTVAPGGGVNALVAARRLGLAACYHGPHGTGRNGDAVRAALHADDVATAQPAAPDGDTGYCLALLEPDGERTFVTVPGAESRQTPSGLAAVVVGVGDAVYLSGYDLGYPVSGPVLGAWVAALPGPAPAGPWLVFDPGPLIGAVPADRLAAVLARTDLLSVSAPELTAVGGVTMVLGRLAPGGVLVLRDGDRGAALHRLDHDPLILPAAPPPGPVRDSSGAGDVHLGALLAGRAAGLDWSQALRLAGHAAAWSLTRLGASNGPTGEQLAAAYPDLRVPAAPG